MSRFGDVRTCYLTHDLHVKISILQIQSRMGNLATPVVAMTTPNVPIAFPTGIPSSFQGEQLIIASLLHSAKTNNEVPYRVRCGQAHLSNASCSAPGIFITAGRALQSISVLWLLMSLEDVCQGPQCCVSQ